MKFPIQKLTCYMCEVGDHDSCAKLDNDEIICNCGCWQD